jgi:hypothetical protein
MDAILGPVAQNINLAKDETGKIYWPVYNVNQIGLWKTQEGYKINMIQQATLYLEGEQVNPADVPINLPTGWSMFGYPRNTPANALTMISPFATQVNIMKNQDGLLVWPLYSFNSIGNMVPGQGYQIQMISPVTFYFPANSAIVAKSDYIRPVPSYFDKSQNTGSNMSLIIPGYAWINQPLPGDEIGIFNQAGMLCGSAVYEEGFSLIPVWGDDELTTAADGMKKEEVFTLRLFSRASKSESEIEITSWNSGDGTYQKNGLAIAAKVEMVPSFTFVLEELFPNPASTSTNIEFMLPYEANIHIGIYNVLGERMQELVNERMKSGEYSLKVDLSAFSNGIYFVRFESDATKMTRSLTVIRK